MLSLKRNEKGRFLDSKRVFIPLEVSLFSSANAVSSPRLSAS